MHTWQIWPALIGSVMAAECYDADGTELGDWYIPCGSNATDWSTCCWKGDTCLPNGLCRLSEGSVYRGPCDNPDWYGCYQVCTGIESSENYVHVEECASDEYCCLGDIDSSSCCNSSSAESFTIDADPAMYSTAIGSNSREHRTISAGAIAGAVVGGVVGLAVIGGVIWFMLHRRPKRTGIGSQGAAVKMDESQDDDSIWPHVVEVNDVTGTAEKTKELR
ncbi:hypothetical protein EDB81DRAFT_250460 [Dactylonectria macrodidyma]|uniref:Uncharacterized protein n=1 Tax=Dactylonectria macrodidyma TaxID=307937 RepID=A0A9P9FJK8_9HYPO|nr:hypothetical protein EDB81DRAFT_250460 [Dactylonectria macrodidyma]